VSITRRILESAQSGWSKLSSLVIVDDEPLSHVDPAALQAELTARKAAREKSRTPVGGSPLAAMATSAASARTKRGQLATERGARVRRERDQRAAAQRSAADEAFRRMKAQAGTSGGTSSGSTSSSGGAGRAATGSARAPRPGSNAAQVAEWYKTLDLAPGAEPAEIKASYRRLMRKYHPDVHAGDPKKQKAATELSMRVTTAYNSLVGYLDGK